MTGLYLMNRNCIRILTFLLVSNVTALVALPRCMHVMSYHQGYAWNDGIEKAVEETLSGKCELRKFYMDSKRNPRPDFIRRKALEAKQYIDKFKPDIVIASDDNASRYLIKPYYKNAKLPIIFNGINWNGDVYGYPYKNATGMVEIAPVKELLDVAQRNIKVINKIIFISDDAVSEHKDFFYYKQAYEQQGFKVSSTFVKTMADWEKAFVDAQSFDFIIIGNNAAIDDWDKQRAARFVEANGKRLTITTYSWMMPYAMLGISKVTSEQGNWAAEVALAVISGTNISDIPITVNRLWNYYQNKNLLKKSSINIDVISRNKMISKDWLNVKN